MSSVKRKENKLVYSAQGYVDEVTSVFPGAVKDVAWQSEDQVTITVVLDSLPDVMEYLYYECGGWFSVMAGNDERPLNGHYALYYILSMEKGEPCFVVVRVEVPADTLEFPSVTPRIPACAWSEREVRDMFGLRPVNLPDMRRLVLPDDWPEGVYPLRKDSMDYRYRPDIASDVENYKFLQDNKGHETTVIPMGPLHITSDEPGHFRLFVDGEDIIDADYRMFYVHRGMEKCAETRLNYDAVTFFADRICGICGCAHSIAYAESVEAAQGIHVPERGQYIRSIMMEVERMHSHLLNLGLVCHYSGFDTGFQHFFRVREQSMDLAEMLTGHRKTYGLNLIGGVRRDILSEQKLETLNALKKLRVQVQSLVDELLSTPNFEARAKGVGILDPEVARRFSPVGPTVRGSGYARDARFVRKMDGYKALAGTSMEARTHDGCDVLSRTLIRVEEFFDSLDMIELMLENAPSGPIYTDDWTYEPHRFGVGISEAPRGEDVHWSMVGDNQKCYRWRVKAATYSNWPVLRYMLRGNTISDAALIIGSIDPCYSCTDRVTIVDPKKRTQAVLSKDELKEYGAHPEHSPLKDKEVSLDV
ncbi:MAG: hydrogenase large subunit [Coriobacteriales bacterium]|jgi:Ni,Fe-hydrogenase III large subunit/Ni,Fe-hydrogenase III component G|nr:hydrogenase large subunit [Coriobacteriales bacterium]